jgi:hypothetical protein
LVPLLLLFARFVRLLDCSLAKQGRYFTMTKRPLLGFLTLTMLFQTCSAHKTSSNNNSDSPEHWYTASVFELWTRLYIEMTSWSTRAAFWTTCALTNEHRERKQQQRQERQREHDEKIIQRAAAKAAQALEDVERRARKRAHDAEHGEKVFL